LAQVFHNRPQVFIKPRARSKGTPISSGWYFGFSSWEGRFRVDAEHLVDAFLFVVGLTGFADVDRLVTGNRVVTRLCVPRRWEDRSPVARGVVVLDAFANPAKDGFFRLESGRLAERLFFCGSRLHHPCQYAQIVRQDCPCHLELTAFKSLRSWNFTQMHIL